ncbi:hypothetical protein [Polymorphobacter fuscus]|uniref:Uncharacterized protein n=1 Tax=Sandarakinorhabdus fusca TaxID=1439888 RepID=A0A7C9KMM3_9SPHN|nr:hypothetical protein [Polymorphobacter fuscus]KAB7647803.1 hypothetical protein F9290_07500 [Polymorphobacter fuscus]MQT17104.1 hypothetical protein [Polymorphobacter fuscus]NJC08904.1 hypothetical protein [Polymorphobacter fuscus]
MTIDKSKPRRARWRGAVAGFALLLDLPGCISAQRRINANQAELYAQAIAETERVARQLENGGPGRHDVRFFLSNAFINQSLATLAGYRVILPDDPDIDLRLTGVELSTLGALPAVTLSATAARGGINADVTMNAVLVATGRPHEFRINVQSLTPVVRLGSVNVSRLPFVQRLLTLRVIDIAAALPTIRLPVEERISIGGAAGTATGRVQTSRPPQTTAPSYLRFTTTVPATAWTGRIVNPRYYFTGDGVYVFGDVR